MCGRFVGFRPIKDLMKYFPIDVATAEVTENFNVAPTQEILAIIRHDDKNHLEKLHWGFVPFWAKDTSIGSRMINARSETVATKPSFRTAFKNRRCLILADGFYEWTGKAGEKQPMFLTLANGKTICLRRALGNLGQSGERANSVSLCYHPHQRSQ